MSQEFELPHKYKDEREQQQSTASSDDAFHQWISSAECSLQGMHDNDHPLPITFNAGWNAALQYAAIQRNEHDKEFDREFYGKIKETILMANHCGGDRKWKAAQFDKICKIWKGEK